MPMSPSISETIKKLIDVCTVVITCPKASERFTSGYVSVFSAGQNESLNSITQLRSIHTMITR